MSKPPPRRRTTKGVAVRRPDGESSARDRKVTVPDLPRSRRNSTAEAPTTAEPEPRRRRESIADGEAPPTARRDSKADSKRATTPPRSRRDSKAPKRDSKAPKIEIDAADELAMLNIRVEAPFRTRGNLPEPEATGYSVIPAPRSSRKPSNK